MHNFFKKAAVILLLFSLGTTTVSASEPTSTKEILEVSYIDEMGVRHVIDLNQCERIAVDAEGNILPQPKQNLSQHTIGSGVTMYYYESGRTGWTITRDTLMSFDVTTDKKVKSYSMGYVRNGKKTNMSYRDNGLKRHSSAFCPADGTYSFFITNKTSDPFTVVSGSVTY